MAKKNIVYGDVPSDFDPAEYARLNPDVVQAGWDPTAHFREYGWKDVLNGTRIYKEPTPTYTATQTGGTVAAPAPATAGVLSTPVLIAIGVGAVIMIGVVILLLKRKKK